MLFKNAIQKIHVYAYNTTTGAAVINDQAQITAYVSLDGTANAVDDTNPAQVDATNMPGVYVFDLTAAETNCDSFALYAKSSTASVRIEPIIGFTTAGAVPAAVAGASTGLLISGTNAGTTTLGALTVTAACTHGSTVLGNTTCGTWTQTGAAGWGATTFASTAFGNTTMGTLTQTGAVSWGATTFNSLVVTTTSTFTGAYVLTDTSTAGSLGKRLADLQTDLDTIDTAGEIATAIWNAQTSGYGGAGTYGDALEAAGAGSVDYAALASAVWKDATAGDFTTSGSIGKSLFTAGVVPGAANGLFIAGANAATTFAALTVTAATTLTGAVVLTDQTTSLSLGKYLKDILDDTAILPGTWVVPGPGTSTLTTTDVDNRLAAWGKTGFALSATGADLIAKTSTFAGAIADAVWDEAQSGHTGAGSFGLYVDGKISEAGGGGLTAAAVADAVWDEVATGHVDAGKAGAQLWTVINTLSSGAAINITTTTTIIESE